MVNLESGFNKNNAEILLKGMWYSELPPIIDFEKMNEKIEDVFDFMNSKTGSYYVCNEFNRIQEFKSIPQTKNRHKDGSEPIVFYDYKNNGSWREMQIPNIIFYLAFVYNTISVFDDLFEPLYLSSEKYGTDVSNSYLIFWDLFIERDHYGEEIGWDIKGHFTNRNINKRSAVMLEENKKRYLAAENSYLYYMKLDVESFFPNLYTHFFDRMANYKPYVDMDIEKDYFAFLDKFNQKINNNQTKGIPAGVFSSHVSSELLMICLDCEIKEIIKTENVGYIRYVDDLTVFADTKEELEKIQPKIQKILNKYRLRINGNKTDILECINNKSVTSLTELKRKFNFMNYNEETPYIITFDDFLEIKNYISDCLTSKRIPQIKSLLTLLTNSFKEDKIIFKEIAGCEKEFFLYCWKLIWKNETLAVHLYKLIDVLLSNMSPNLQKQSIRLIFEKLDSINEKWADSMIQIWHYYILVKNDTGFKRKIINELSESKNMDLNPIIVSMLVTEGKHKNNKLFSFIKNRYLDEIDETNEKWKDSIMFSKWWLPLFTIVVNDEYNYFSWVNSNSFPDVLKYLK